MISGKYKIRILWDLKDGPRRYSEIRTGLLRGADGTAEIAPRVLSRELKALTESGLIARKDYGLVPPKVVEDVFVYGSPADCRDKIKAYCENGITTPIINIIPTARDPEGQREQSLAAFRALAPR